MKIPDFLSQGSVTAPDLSARSQRTFAPPSVISDLREVIQPMQGPVVEVLVAWQERIIHSYHFKKSQVVRLGPSSRDDIFVPQPYSSQTLPFLQITATQCKVLIPTQCQMELVSQSSRVNLKDAQKSGRALPFHHGYLLAMEQGEVVCLDFGERDYLVFVRFVPATAEPALAPAISFSAEQVVAMSVVAVVLSLFIYMMAEFQPAAGREPHEENTATVEFVRPPPKVPKTPVIESQQKEPVAPVLRPAAAPPQTSPPTGGSSEIKNRSDNMTRPHKGPRHRTAKSRNFIPTEKNDGPVGVLGVGGLQEKIDQLSGGNNQILVAAQDSQGSGGNRHGLETDPIANRMVKTPGGKGAQTTGIGEIGTRKGSGSKLFGTDGLGQKTGVQIATGAEGPSVIEGSIDREAVRRTVRSILTQIKSCYERGLNTNPQLEGKVVVRFLIEDHGVVRRASVPSSTLKDTKVEACIVERIMAQRFPDPPVGTTAEVDYPFVFGAQSRP